MILALDTSTEQASVAFVPDAGPSAECSWTARGNHSKHLDKVMSILIDLQGIDLTAVVSIAVALGPGSFSGTRVGISAAKGYGIALAVPVAGISTLDIIGFQARKFPGPVLAAIPAGRGQVYIARYPGNQDFALASDIALADVDAVAEDLAPGTLLVGPATSLLEAAAVRRGRQVRVAPPPSRLRRASFLAELGKRYFAAGGEDQRDVMEPLYLRKSAAEEQRGR